MAYDVVIVGAGPNGLTAAAVLSMAGLSVAVLERDARIGGGCRSEALTLPGFVHDVCSAIHPMGLVSPIFRRLPLQEHGLEWVASRVPLAHPFDDGTAAILTRELSETAAALRGDGPAWEQLLGPFVDHHETLFSEILRPIRVPRHPWLMARFGLLGLRSCEALVNRFDGSAARALFAGNAAHSFLPLDAPGTASFGLVLAIAGHAVDWPCVRGGSQRIADALAACARAHGCEVHTEAEVRSLSDLPESKAVMFDVTPRQLVTIAGGALTLSYRRHLSRFRYGPGVFKVDYALSGPIPWTAVDCAGAATVHVGGTYDEIARSEGDASAGRICEAPFVLVAQQSVADKSRVPPGRHTAWAYCHVPHASGADMASRIERQIERFAPGFRDLILATHVSPPAAVEARNPNMIGGDIVGGANELDQVILRPVARWDPYSTSNPRLFLCSSSTPPGAGVHGMCGYWAARTVMKRVFRRRFPPSLEV